MPYCMGTDGRTHSRYERGVQCADRCLTDECETARRRESALATEYGESFQRLCLWTMATLIVVAVVSLWLSRRTR